MYLEHVYAAGHWEFHWNQQELLQTPFRRTIQKSFGLRSLHMFPNSRSRGHMSRHVGTSCRHTVKLEKIYQTHNLSRHDTILPILDTCLESRAGRCPGTARKPPTLELMEACVRMPPGNISTVDEGRGVGFARAPETFLEAPQMGRTSHQS